MLLLLFFILDAYIYKTIFQYTYSYYTYYYNYLAGNPEWMTHHQSYEVRINKLHYLTSKRLINSNINALLIIQLNHIELSTYNNSIDSFKW